jgi:hypothetical protein
MTAIKVNTTLLTCLTANFIYRKLKIYFRLQNDQFHTKKNLVAKSVHVPFKNSKNFPKIMFTSRKAKKKAQIYIDERPHTKKHFYRVTSVYKY